MSVLNVISVLRIKSFVALLFSMLRLFHYQFNFLPSVSLTVINVIMCFISSLVSSETFVSSL